MQTIIREDLLQCLEMVRPGLSAQDNVAQSTCFAFTDGRVFTFNDEVYCSYVCPLKIEGAVAATPLLSLLSKMKDHTISIEEGKGKLLIKGNRRRAGIRMESEVLLTNVKVPKENSLWSKLHDEFCTAVDIVRRCAGTDESLFSLTCVHITADFVEAFDNSQISRYPLKIDIKKPILVSQKSLLHIGSSTMTEWAQTKSWLHFRNADGLVISCRLYIEDYPNLDNIVNVKGRKIELPAKLTEATSIAEIFSDSSSDQSGIKIRLMKGRMTIKGEGADGWYKETKRLQYDGPDLQFSIAPKMILEITKRRHECEITQGLLKVDGGKFVYVTCLDMIDDEEEND